MTHPRRTVLLPNLASAPFPEQEGPGAAVVVPLGFSTVRGLRVCVYIRGFSNCVENVVADADGICSPDGRTHHATHLAQQLASSGSNTLLVIPELVRDEQSGDPGKLSRPGSLDALLTEVFERMAPYIGRLRVADIGHLGLMSHSGGYQAVAAMIRQAPPALRTVALLDSLYGDQSDFEGWVSDNAEGFGATGGFRFADIYSTGAGTANKSRALATQLQDVVPEAEFVFDDDPRRSLTADDLRHHVVFKHSGRSHDAIAQTYPEQLWRAGW
jgi:hypothetical protein